MEKSKFIEHLSELKLSVFSSNDAMKILNKNSDYTSLYLHRLKKASIITYIQKGIYALNNATSIEIATSIIKPSYMTMLSALYYHGLINQIQNIITIFNTRKSSYMSININDGLYNINFVKVKPSIIFGYKRYENKYAYSYVAEPEKAIVDMLYLPNLCPLSYAADIINNKAINKKKLIKYAKRTRSNVTLNRLMNLLDNTQFKEYNQTKKLIIN